MAVDAATAAPSDARAVRHTHIHTCERFSASGGEGVCPALLYGGGRAGSLALPTFSQTRFVTSFTVSNLKRGVHVCTYVYSARQDTPKTNYSKKTFSGGCLGSRNDEERSEMRYVMRIAESSESSKF